jgi:molybdopterin synthase catalytic subunit
VAPPPSPGTFGILLTGGASARMGRDKASVEVGSTTLARRTAALLGAATERAVEVGPGRSGLPAVSEVPAGGGPLAGVVAGFHALVGASGEKRPCIVVACDLPELTADLLGWLARHPGDSSVVPVVEGRAQPLCARWSVADLERAAAQLAAGERSLRSVFGPDAVLAAEDAWASVAPSGALADVDTPGDLARHALAPPAGDDWVGLARAALPSEAATRWAVLPRCGAVVTFLGTVRDHADGRAGVEELVYEAYGGPALARMQSVVDAARARWPSLGRVAVLHRLGPLVLGETAVVVVVSSGHRREAFAAGAYVIDTVKESVPIWKHERWDGGEGWGTGAQPVQDVPRGTGG